MKKMFLFLATLSLVILLTACGKATSPLVISKIYGARAMSDNVIELYNPSDKDIELGKYSLQFYTNSSKEVGKTFALSGTVKANSYFAISGPSFSKSDYATLIDLKLPENLPYNGNDAIELVLNKTSIDLVGYNAGMSIAFSERLTLIRLGNKKDYAPSATFDPHTFIYYLPELFEYLKNDNYEIKTLEDLYKGPKLDDRYKELSFADPDTPSIGYGGAVLVENTSIADGDTASFKASNGFSGGSMRYYYINTPEVDNQYTSAEPWGYVASKYNKKYLLVNSSTKEIYVQSIPGVNLKETNGRSLGLVWVNGHLSQFLIVSEGLTERVGSTYTESDLQLHYKNVPYLTFLRFAEDRASDNGWGVYGYPIKVDGEKSPDWSYTNNKNTTTDPVWKPHLTLPWETN
ncbi:MAG: lamin tail domain-containing protein [Acholeplasma sp.]|nr:lamin tail domain-containing protein [Acholeplasma sp.]